VRHEDLTRGVDLETDNSSRTRSGIEKLIVVRFAGAAAQRRYDRRSWRSFLSSGDYESAARLAAAVCSSPAASEAFLKWLAVTADDLIVRDCPVEINRFELAAGSLTAHSQRRRRRFDPATAGELCG
jgi:hypothetical protein